MCCSFRRRETSFREADVAHIPIQVCCGWLAHTGQVSSQILALTSETRSVVESHTRVLGVLELSTLKYVGPGSRCSWKI